MPHLLTACALATLLVILPGESMSRAARAAEQPLAAAPESLPPRGEFGLEDPVEPLDPVRPRTSREEDRVRALALFAAARVAEQKQDYPLALKNYQRAFRFDPQAVPALREIVQLTFNLDRQLEGVRYAVLLAQRDSSDATSLRRLAVYLTEEGDTERALSLYERALAQQERSGARSDSNHALMWMEMGRLYFIARQHAKAADRFAQVIKVVENPKEFDLTPAVQKALVSKGDLTYQIFGESFLEAGRPVEAIAAFNKANEFKANEGLHLYNLARADVKNKRPAQALARLEEYFEKHLREQGTGPYETFVEALTAVGQDDQATARLEKLREADADNVPLTFFLAERYRKAGDLAKAEPLYAALVERRSERPPLEAMQGLIDVYRRQHNLDKLIETLGQSAGRVATLTPLDGSGKDLLADAKTSAELVALVKKQLAEQPDKVDYGRRVAAGLVALGVKDFASAKELFDAALKAEGAKPAEVLINWGLELFLAGQFADAVQVFERGLDEKLLPENNAAIPFYLAGALEMGGRTDEALTRAKQAAELEKENPRYASRLAWIQFHARRLDDARASYQALLDKFDKVHDSPEARDVMRDARLVLSNIAVMQNKADEAEEWLEQLLDEFPEDTGALNDLGYLWADGGKHLELARDMIQVAVDSDPKNMAYRDSLGWVQYKLGNYADAVAELRVAAGVSDPDGVVLDHLADAQWKLGHKKEALSNWQRAVEAFEKDEETDKAAQTREKIEKLKAEQA